MHRRSCAGTAQLSGHHAAHLTSTTILTVLAATNVFLVVSGRRPPARTDDDADHPADSEPPKERDLSCG